MANDVKQGVDLIPYALTKAITEADGFLKAHSAELVIQTDDQFKGASGLIIQCKEKINEVEKSWEETRKQPWVVELEKNRDTKGKLVTLLKSKITVINNAIFQYDQKKKAEARLRQDEENRKALEAQQALLEKAFVHSKKADEHQSEGNERWAEHHAEKASVLESQAQSIVPATVVVEAPKVQGLSITKVYKAAVTDKAAFVKYCLDTNSLHFLAIEEGKLNTEAKNRAGLNPPPGVTFEQSGKTIYRKQAA